MTSISSQHCLCWRPRLMVTHIKVALHCTIHLQGLKPGSSSLAQPRSPVPFPANRRDMCASHPRVWGLQMWPGWAGMVWSPHWRAIPTYCKSLWEAATSPNIFHMLQLSLYSESGCEGLTTTVKHLAHLQVTRLLLCACLCI